MCAAGTRAGHASVAARSGMQGQAAALPPRTPGPSPAASQTGHKSASQSRTCTTTMFPTAAAACAARGEGGSPCGTNFSHRPVRTSIRCTSFVAPASRMPAAVGHGKGRGRVRTAGPTDPRRRARRCATAGGQRAAPARRAAERQPRLVSDARLPQSPPPRSRRLRMLETPGPAHSRTATSRAPAPAGEGEGGASPGLLWPSSAVAPPGDSEGRQGAGVQSGLLQASRHAILEHVLGPAMVHALAPARMQSPGPASPSPPSLPWPKEAPALPNSTSLAFRRSPSAPAMAVRV